MNWDPLINRLFDAAKQAPQEKPGALPSALEARTLSAWRRSGATDDSAWLAGVFRRAAVCAGVIMLVSIVWTYRDSANIASGPVAMANYQLNSHLPP